MKLEYIIFNGPPMNIYCDFEDGFLVKLSIGESGFSNAQKREYISDGQNFFIKELKNYFSGHLKKFKQKIKFKSGTDFEKHIWQTLLKIPYGETRTYKWLAEKAGFLKASRAAGNALSKNPLPVIVPCHRIIKSDGSLGGFTGGTDIKIKLLKVENIVIKKA